MALVSGICDRFLEGYVVWLFSKFSLVRFFFRIRPYVKSHKCSPPFMEGFLGFLFPTTEEANEKDYGNDIESTSWSNWLVQWSVLVPFIGGR